MGYTAWKCYSQQPPATRREPPVLAPWRPQRRRPPAAAAPGRPPAPNYGPIDLNRPARGQNAALGARHRPQIPTPRPRPTPPPACPRPPAQNYRSRQARPAPTTLQAWGCGVAWLGEARGACKGRIEARRTRIGALGAPCGPAPPAATARGGGIMASGCCRRLLVDRVSRPAEGPSGLVTCGASRRRAAPIDWRAQSFHRISPTWAPIGENEAAQSPNGPLASTTTDAARPKPPKPRGRCEGSCKLSAAQRVASAVRGLCGSSSRGLRAPTKPNPVATQAPQGRRAAPPHPADGHR